MIFCLLSMSGDEMDDRGTEAWTNLMDRGGLWHMSDMKYDFFHAMEVEVRMHFDVMTVKDSIKDKQMVIKKVVGNEDVLFKWWLLLDNEDDHVGNKLLKIIADFYLTIRGFSFATSFVELYKQLHCKGLQRSKGLRKELFTSNLSSS